MSAKLDLQPNVDAVPLPNPGKILYTVDEVCHVLRIGRTHAYQYLGTRIAITRLGRRTLVHRDDLERFLREQRQPLIAESSDGLVERERENDSQ